MSIYQQGCPGLFHFVALRPYYGMQEVQICQKYANSNRRGAMQRSGISPVPWRIFFVQRQLRTISYSILFITILLSITTRSSSAASFPATRQHIAANFPTVDPSYIYDQLFFMATHFQHRES